MNRRRVEHPLHERIHGAPPPIGAAPSPGLTEPPRVRPCWVTDEHGRQPALLLEWRRTAAGWQGRVVRPVLDEDAWLVVEEWVRADLLEQG